MPAALAFLVKAPGRLTAPCIQAFLPLVWLYDLDPATMIFLYSPDP